VADLVEQEAGIKVDVRPTVVGEYRPAPNGACPVQARYREFAGGFPFPNRVLRFFPIARTERLPDLVAADESVDPDRATAAAVLSPFVAVLANFTSISVCPDRKSGVPNWIASWPTLIGGASTS